KPPLPSGAMILYLPRDWPLKSKAEGVRAVYGRQGNQASISCLNDNSPMLPRFYAPDLDPDLALVALSPEEARHLTRVLRLGAGAEVSVFDGRGTEFRAEVEVAVRETVSLRLLERLPAPPSLSVQTVVVQAVLKGSSMDDAIRDATMMGAE